MAYAKTEEFSRFVSILTRLAPADFSAYTIAKDAEALRSIARRMDKINERQCNGYADWKGAWDEAASQRDEKRFERLEQRALEIAKTYGLGVYTQGDPRGWPLRLLRPGDNPDASADGIGVPV